MNLEGYSSCYLPGLSRSPTDLVTLVCDDAGVLLDIDRSNPRWKKGYVDCGGAAILPSLVDQHLHGLDDLDCLRHEDDIGLGLRLGQRGVAAYCASTKAMPRANLLRWLSSPDQSASTKPGAVRLGVHIEGSFMKSARLGAHDEDFAYGSDIELFRALLSTDATISQITVSPEAYGSTHLIAQAVAHGVRVALGHTDAGYEESLSAVAAGATCVTHIMNAMVSISAREPGLLGLAAEAGLFVELIANGAIVHPRVLDLVFRMIGPERVIMVSDCLAISSFGGQRRSDGVYRRGDVIMGGALALPALVPTMKAVLGGSLVDLIRVTSQNALAYLGLEPSWPPPLGSVLRVIAIDRDWNVQPMSPRFTLSESPSDA